MFQSNFNGLSYTEDDIECRNMSSGIKTCHAYLNFLKEFLFLIYLLILQAEVNFPKPKHVDVPKSHKIAMKRKAVKQEPKDYDDKYDSNYGGMVGESLEVDHDIPNEGKELYCFLIFPDQFVIRFF